MTFKNTLTILACTISLCLASLSSSAQENAKKWDFRPTLTSMNMAMMTYDPENDSFRHRELSTLGVGFKWTSNFSTDVRYDLMNAAITGCETRYKVNDRLNFSVGIMRNIYLYEYSVAPNRPGPFGASQTAYYLGGYTFDLSGMVSRGRDCGILINTVPWMGANNRAIVSLSAGIFNGNGYHFKDNNKAKDLQGKLIIAPTKEMKIGICGMYGKYTLADTENELAGRARISTAFDYEGNVLFFRAENVYGTTNGIKTDGAYALTGAKFNQGKMNGSIRFDSVAKDITDASTRISKAQVCFTHFVKGSDMSYRLGYARTFYAAEGRADTGSIQLSMVLRFSAKI